ncbi:MAG: DUF885 domain-containing protein [Clostridia bacterium]|nr:DUF885 domain-containing protein [Clostridia bacterium]
MKKSIKTLALLLACLMMFNLVACSQVQDFFSLEHSSRHSSKKNDDDDDDEKPKKTKETEETEETEETTETEGTTDISETSGETETSESVAAPQSYDFDLVPLTYPDHAYTYDEIHPKKANGTLEGTEAVDLLNEVEQEVLQEFIGNSYVDLVILYDDPEALGYTLPEPSWGEVDLSDESRIEELQFYNDELAKLYTINRDSLETDDQIFYDKIVYDLEEYAYVNQFSVFNYFTTSLNPLIGPQCDLLFMLEIFTFDDIQEAEDYIILVRDTERYFGDLCTFEEMRAVYGYASSPEIYEQIAESFDALVEQKDDCFLYDSFVKRVSDIKGISQEDIDRLVADHEDAMQNSFFTGFVDCASRMRALKSFEGTDKGLCEMEYGDQYYEWLYRSKSNADYTIDEGIKLIEDRFSANMDLMNSIVEGGITWYTEYLAHDYSKGDTKANLDFLSVAILDDFDELPAHDYALMDVPEAMQENFSPAAYLGYHLDKMDDNLIITNKSNIDDTFGITCAHEGYPGHMYQSIYSRSICSHPYMYICDSTAYAEGWATYVENFSFRYFAENEDAAALIKIDNELNVLLMARMDIGIHYEAWTLEDCANWASDLLGYQLSTDALSSTYYLLVSDPTYAVKYGIGFLLTNSIFDNAVERHPDVDIQIIHMAYLNCQPATFNQIDARIDDFIAAAS